MRGGGRRTGPCPLPVVRPKALRGGGGGSPALVPPMHLISPSHKEKGVHRSQGGPSLPTSRPDPSLHAPLCCCPSPAAPPPLLPLSCCPSSPAAPLLLPLLPCCPSPAVSLPNRLLPLPLPPLLTLAFHLQGPHLPAEAGGRIDHTAPGRRRDRPTHRRRRPLHPPPARLCLPAL